MICQICREAGEMTESADSDTPLQDLVDLHAGCKGATHCDCQHKPTIETEGGSRAQRRQ